MPSEAEKLEFKQWDYFFFVLGIINKNPTEESYIVAKDHADRHGD